MLAVAALLAGCGGSLQTGSGADGAGGEHKDTKIVHEECDIASSGAERVDVNGDGKPDLIVVKSGQAEVCRAVDLNFDGVTDLWVYQDGGGQLRRRESDYDRDGRVDEISLYSAGALVEKQRATTMNGKLDTWHFYEAGRLARTERDSDGDAVVDQWWEYTAAKGPQCPLIHSDNDGDGRPDPGSSIDVCGEGSGYVPPSRDAPEKDSKSKFEKGELATPAEVDQKEMPADSAEPPAAGAPPAAAPAEKKRAP